MSISVGLVGARGYVGRELIDLIDARSDLDLAYAASRELAGRSLRELSPQFEGDLEFEALEPADIGARRVDAIILGLPNDLSAPFVEAVDASRPQTCIVDLSGDHRAAKGWVYGLPELKREPIREARRIANPGCYATAAQLALAPVRNIVRGPATVFGVSGWSGAGTKPSRKNDPEALRDNIQPYALSGHAHEAEIARGIDLAVRFHPSVAPFFRGLTIVASAMIDPAQARSVADRFAAAYADEPFVSLQAEPAEPAAVAGRHDCLIGGIAADAEGRFVATAALDNLLKGAASQAMQNLNLAFELPETAGLRS